MFQALGRTLASPVSALDMVCGTVWFWAGPAAGAREGHQVVRLPRQARVPGLQQPRTWGRQAFLSS